MDHILLPLDSSDFSRAALATVCRLFDPARYRLTLLHVAPLPAGYTKPIPAVALDAWVFTGAESVDDAVDTYARQSLAEFRAALLDKLGHDLACLEEAGFQVALAAEFGSPAGQICRFVENNEVDLVVMATHGRRGLARGLLGSVAESVVRRLHCPVLLVRPEDA